jgi:hypothetical protein
MQFRFGYLNTEEYRFNMIKNKLKYLILIQNQWELKLEFCFQIMNKI